MPVQLDAFKARRRGVWEAGEYSALTEYISEVGEPARSSRPKRFPESTFVGIDYHDSSKQRDNGRCRLALQAGEQRVREVFVHPGGFPRFRRATETPFHIVLEARP
jgi:hypothetical protein